MKLNHIAIVTAALLALVASGCGVATGQPQAVVTVFASPSSTPTPSVTYGDSTPVVNAGIQANVAGLHASYVLLRRAVNATGRSDVGGARAYIAESNRQYNRAVRLYQGLSLSDSDNAQALAASTYAKWVNSMGVAWEGALYYATHGSRTLAVKYAKACVVDQRRALAAYRTYKLLVASMGV